MRSLLLTLLLLPLLAAAPAAAGTVSFVGTDDAVPAPVRPRGGAVWTTWTPEQDARIRVALDVWLSRERAAVMARQRIALASPAGGRGAVPSTGGVAAQAPGFGGGGAPTAAVSGSGGGGGAGGRRGVAANLSARNARIAAVRARVGARGNVSP